MFARADAARLSTERVSAGVIPPPGRVTNTGRWFVSWGYVRKSWSRRRLDGRGVLNAGAKGWCGRDSCCSRWVSDAREWGFMLYTLSPHWTPGAHVIHAGLLGIAWMYSTGAGSSIRGGVRESGDPGHGCGRTAVRTSARVGFHCQVRQSKSAPPPRLPPSFEPHGVLREATVFRGGRGAVRAGERARGTRLCVPGVT